MNKKFPLALIPVLALGTAVHAQSSVTLYGRVNTSVEYQDTEGSSSQTGLHSNSAFIGFRGVEDLGGGLEASFLFEQWIDATDGSTTDFERETHLQLKGDFGALKLGNYDSSAYLAIADPVSMHNHDTGSSADALFSYIVPLNSKIGYISPEFGGFSAELGYGFEDDHNDESPYDITLKYASGDFSIAASHVHWDNAESFGLRALYRNSQFALGGYAMYDEDGFGENLGERWSARLAGAYFLGASEFHANVGWADDYDDLTDSSATQFTLGYNYNLSLRTKVYAFYTRIDSDDNALYGPAPGQDFESFAVGIRHLF